MGATGASRQWLFRLAALGAALVFSLVFAELALRVLGVSYPIFFEPDPVAGSRLRPGLRAWYEGEGRAFVEVNRAGYRDRDHPETKPPGEWRFAVLGDSYSEALQVDFDATWWNVTAEALRTCPALEGREPVPVNFGISGHGTAQQLETLRQRVWRWDPDYVVLAFVPNDLTDNSPVLLGRDARPYYALDEAGRLQLDDSFRTSPGYLRRTSSAHALRRELSDWLRSLQLVVELRRVLARRELHALRGGQVGTLYRPPETDAWRETWRVTEALLVEVARRVEARERGFLLVAVSSPHQAHPDPEHRRRRLEQAGPGSDLFYWNERLGGIARAHGIDYLSLSEPFQAQAVAAGECLHGFENAEPCGGHWNERGHRLAGRLVAEHLCRTLASGARPAAADPSPRRAPGRLSSSVRASDP